MRRLQIELTLSEALYEQLCVLNSDGLLDLLHRGLSQRLLSQCQHWDPDAGSTVSRKVCEKLEQIHTRSGLPLFRNRIVLLLQDVPEEEI